MCMKNTQKRGIMMKVLMLNGSSKPNGNTFRSLVEVGEQLKKEGIDYEIFQTGAGPVKGLHRLRSVYGKGVYLYG